MAVLDPVENTFPGLQTEAFSLCFLTWQRGRVLWYLFLKGHQSYWIRASPLWLHLTFIISLKALSLNTVTLGIKAWTYEFGWDTIEPRAKCKEGTRPFWNSGAIFPGLLCALEQIASEWLLQPQRPGIWRAICVWPQWLSEASPICAYSLMNLLLFVMY